MPRKFGHGFGRHLLAHGNPRAPPFREQNAAIPALIEEAESQECDIGFAYYPERGFLAIGLNGLFDIDRALDNTDADTALLDALTPLEETEYTGIENDLVADQLFAFDVSVSSPQVRRWMDAADYTENTITYHEQVNGEVTHERTYHARTEENTPDNPWLDPSTDIEAELEDADIDVDEIIEDLEEDETGD